MRIVIESIPHNQQRYDTLGDWWFDPDGTLQIRVSTGEGGVPPEHEFLIGLHELIEVQLCQARGITQEMVDKFDLDPANQGDFEPGDLPGAPYHKEHRFAMLIEHLMAHELGIIGYGRVE
jgi:hypothetical protein